jgi:thymidylate kinase
MPFIAFLGCDGSGKSAVIQGLKSHLEAEDKQVTLGHWRPKPFSKPNKESPPADDPHGQSPRGLISSVLKLGWLWANWWLGWFSGLRKASRDGYVLFDRYHGDLLVDPKRYRYGGPMWLARLATGLMPQPDRVIFLDAPPEVLLSRKQEVSAESLEKARRAYLALCNSSDPRFAITDASQPLPSVLPQLRNSFPADT